MSIKCKCDDKDAHLHTIQVSQACVQSYENSSGVLSTESQQWSTIVKYAAHHLAALPLIQRTGDSIDYKTHMLQSYPAPCC